MAEYIKDQTKKILKGYLRDFYVPVDPRFTKFVDKQKIDPGKCDYFVWGPRKLFRPFIAYYLVKNGRKDWITFNAYELIEIYLGKYEEYNSIFDLNAPFAIMTYGNEEFENKRQWDVINQYVAWRQLEKKRTLIFGFDNKAYNEYGQKMSLELRQGFKVISLY